MGAQGLDGSRVRFAIERRDGAGLWQSITEVTAQVSGGKACARVKALHPGGAHGEDSPDPVPRYLRFRAVISD